MEIELAFRLSTGSMVAGSICALLALYCVLAYLDSRR